MCMNEDARERFIDAIDELERAAVEYGDFEHATVMDHTRVEAARRVLIGLWEAREPKEEP